jgi:hypothetical protein
VWAFTAIAPFVGRWWRCGSPIRSSPRTQRAPSADRPRVRCGRVALSLATVGYAAVASFIVLDLDANGTGHGATAFTALAVTVVLTRLIGGDLPIGSAHFGAAGAAAGRVVGLALIALATSLPSPWRALSDGAAFALIYPSLSLVVVNSVPESPRAHGARTFTAFFDIGVGVGAPWRAGRVGGIPPHSGSPPPARSAPSRWPMRSEGLVWLRHRHQSLAPLDSPPRAA